MESKAQSTPVADIHLPMVLASLFEDFVHYQNTKDIPALLNCLHQASPAYPAMKQSMEALFDKYTLQVDVHAATFSGFDGLYAYYRFEQTILKVAGPVFQDARVENLIVFRECEANWKIWSYLSLWMSAL